MISLLNQRVLITGGSRGIGKAAALLFARAGADVLISYQSREADAKATVADIEWLGRKAYAFSGDLADPVVVDGLFNACQAKLGGLDCFVGNAGIWPVEDVPLKSMDPARWRKTMAANLDAIFLTTRAAIRMMAPGGRIVLVGSTAGQRGESMHADYAATKGAMISLVKSLAIECAPGITVNCVAPGWVDTEMSGSAFSDGGKERIAKTIPLQRVPPAEDIAGPILFLCSPLARHITGEILNVNGGSVLCG